MSSIVRVIALILIAGFSYFGYLLWHGHHLSKEYILIEKGDPESLVKQKLGTPDKISGAPEYVAWDSEDSIHANTGECIREYLYRAPLAIDGEEWTVGFNREGKVVSKFDLHSP